MLHRAFVYSLLVDRDAPSEFTVFFECAMNANAEARLQRQLALIWQVPEGAIQMNNLSTEGELRTHWCWAPEKAASRDLELLQTGHGPEGAIYANPATTMLLVTPFWHTRLAHAQELAARTLRMRLGQAVINNAVRRVRADKVVAV